MDLSCMQKYKQTLVDCQRWFIEHLEIEGHLKEPLDNINLYSLLPFALLSVGLREECHRSIHYLLHTYATPDGGLRYHRDNADKPAKQCLPYAMSWIGIAAHTIGRFEVAYPYSRYLRNYYDPEQGAFTAVAPYGQIDAVLDVFSSTLLGWFAIYTGDLKKAQRAGNFLQRCMALQTTKDEAFYLRLESEGRLITSFDDPFIQDYVVTSQTADRNITCLALSVVFLCKLYTATQQEIYLRSAQSFFESCTHFDTKLQSVVGWSSAVLANITKEQRYITIANNVASNIVSCCAEQDRFENNVTEQALSRYFMNVISLAEIVNELSTV